MNTQSTLQVIEYKGSGGIPAQEGQTLTVYYYAAFSIRDLDMGRWIDASYTRDPNYVRFVLGKGQVLKGIEMGVQGMRLASTRRLIVPSQLAFGDRGIAGKVPPNTDIAFEIYLVEIE